MEKKEALLIAEEILRMVINTESPFDETIHEYICEKLDISDQSLKDVLHIISDLKNHEDKK